MELTSSAFPGPNPSPIQNSNLHQDLHPYPTSASTRALESLFDAFLHTDVHSSPSGMAAVVLEEVLRRQSSDADKVELLRSLREFGLHLYDSASRLWRQHKTHCNSLVWPLSHDLNIKVFSLLDIHSLCQAAASCSLFKKIAMEPACYRNVDLTYCNVDNSVVAKIIQNAGQYLRSLKLGSPTPAAEFGEDLQKMPRESWALKFLLSKSCLGPLMACNGAAGGALQTLHLYNLPELDSRNLCKAIAVCKQLLDLEMVGLCVSVKKVLDSVTLCCHNLTRLCIQSPRNENANRCAVSIKTSSCYQIVSGCPNISSLILQGFKLSDQKAQLMLKGLHHLLRVDFSGADFLTGSFLRELVLPQDQKLESLVLHGCFNLRESEIERLLAALIAGEWKSLKHLDVCNGVGLISTAARSERFHELQLASVYRRSCLTGETLLTVHNARPELEIRADSGEEKCPNEGDLVSLTSSFCYSAHVEHLQQYFVPENVLPRGMGSSMSTTNSSNSEQYSYINEFDIDTESNDEEENEDEYSKFLSPYNYYSWGDGVVDIDGDTFDDDDGWW